MFDVICSHPLFDRSARVGHMGFVRMISRQDSERFSSPDAAILRSTEFKNRSNRPSMNDRCRTSVLRTIVAKLSKNYPSALKP